MLLIFAAAIFAAMAFGSVSLSPSRIAGAFNGTDSAAAVILFRLRLPRVAASALAGAGLAVAGFILQTVTDNDLCAPNIIGVNSGAGFGVMLILCLFPSMWRMQPVFAFAGALLTTLLVLGIVGMGRRFEQKSTIVLAGVAVSSMLSAAIAMLSLKFPDVLSSYTAFSVGGFSGVSLKQLTVPAIMIAVCVGAAMFIAPKLGMLCLGDEAAATLGVNVRAIRLFAVIIASALCGAVVSFAGLLGFVGLVVPHIIRRLTGGTLRKNLPLAAICGAALVILSDLAGRTLFAPGELPAGIIMALIGAPFFIYLLTRRRGRQ